ncbi:DUF397 domain-containing protein [Kitasatospora sp. NBC_01560]|uniref:DUF397 domain-containing protein n=1 Tax=Kitasatospora sp. NBC_01560 TaxID=2975965 RepID=UPI003866D370
MMQDYRGSEWRKSTHSNGEGDCVEVADGVPGAVPVRDSKDPDGPTLTFTTDAWRSFLTAIHTGEL